MTILVLVLSVNTNQIRHWIRLGDFEKLDQLVLDGKGAKLIGEFSPDKKVRNYLKSLPSFMVSTDYNFSRELNY